MRTETSLRLLRVPALLTLASILPGCFVFGPEDCRLPEEIATVEPRQPIRVPEDLDDLDQMKSLAIPKATTPPRASPDECLDRPPRFVEQG